ncbi:hypothetical protein EKE94_07980 [Mesobaculum littorinae]|uniref:Uncharacterized protein n=1 Tax=Mesobaculum littorinae TaxID=2486419 RepID=A0A438AJK4_9RHOB|nr:hypothetical protein [Mesobaculum littorinae]RVV98826.1 hypothetical protein EKE94_07980 [Mesobaculum littorinae]
MSFNRKLSLGTDVAHFFIFDPETLGYAATWPIDWYDTPAVWQHVSGAEHMVAWCTGGDGGYAIRLTTEGLTEDEKQLAGASWTFPLNSTGRVLIDGGDLLPNEDRSFDTPQDDQWIELAPGPWHVTVTAIEWTAADLPEEQAAKLFANYVVSLTPADEAATPRIARRPPDLICLRSEPANDALPEPGAAPADTEDSLDLSQPMPAGQASNVVPAPGHFTSEGESDILTSISPGTDSFDAFELPYFMAPSVEVGAIGQVCWLTGRGGPPGKPPRFSLTAQMPARITEIIGRLHEGRVVPEKKTWIFGAKPPPLGDYAAPLLQVRVQAVDPDITAPDDIPVEVFRAALLSSLSDGALAGALGGQARFHHIVLSASDDYQQLANFALHHLPISATRRAALSAMDFAPRIQALMDQVTSA